MSCCAASATGASMYCPDLPAFQSLSSQGNLIPVYREIMADMDTPVSAFRKIDDGCYAFLLESIEGGEKWARYTFLGSNPSVVLRSRGGTVEILESGRPLRREEVADPLGFLKNYLARYTPVEVDGVPRFFGGAVGYLGYDMVRHFERLPKGKPAVIGAWDAYFVITDTLVIFDNVRQKIKVVSNAYLGGEATPEEAYAEAAAKIDAIIAKLQRQLPPPPGVAGASQVAFTSNVSRVEFEESVVRAKEYVKAGDIIQVVLSQRFTGDLTVDPLDI
jgi:anthranilate synthase component I